MTRKPDAKRNLLHPRDWVKVAEWLHTFAGKYPDASAADLALKASQTLMIKVTAGNVLGIMKDEGMKLPKRRSTNQSAQICALQKDLSDLRSEFEQLKKEVHNAKS